MGIILESDSLLSKQPEASFWIPYQFTENIDSTQPGHLDSPNRAR